MVNPVWEVLRDDFTTPVQQVFEFCIFLFYTACMSS